MPGDKPRFAGLYISVSQLKTYIRCPRQYELHYVRGEPAAFIPIPLAFGSAFHAALAYFYTVLKDTASPPSLQDLQDVFAASWENAGSGPLPLQQAEEEDVGVDHLAKGNAMLTVFYAQAMANDTQVMDVERGFSVDLHDPETGEVLEEKLVGALDLVIKDGDRNIVVEHKSSARRWGDDQLRYDIQPTAYKLAARQLGLGTVGVRLQVVTKTKVPTVQVEDLHRNQHDEDDFMRVLVGVLRAIDAGAFYPIRGWQCRGCQYAHACVENRVRS